jgi:hypothetical protein
VNTSTSRTTQSAHMIGEVPGADRLLGRARDELADAMTWLAWYAPGTYTAVMDYLDYCNGDPIPWRGSATV